jgi:homoserine kinase
MTPLVTIKVPASTANLGPGFDTLGAALSLFLKIDVFPLADPSSLTVLEYEGDSADSVPLALSENLITQVACRVSTMYNTSLPLKGLKLSINNQIPLGRGLGSSGSAVVAGVLLANALCRLNLTKEEILHYATLEEGHPDNVSASVYGGVTASMSRFDASMKLARPVQTVSVPYSPTIKAVVLIPDLPLSTKAARAVLPQSYTRSQVVSNLQNVAVLVLSLGSATLGPRFEMIHEAIKDSVHQPYRGALVPGLKEILALDPKAFPGLLGVCLSGAGPTVLALATENLEAIGEAMLQRLQDKGLSGHVQVLDIESEGASTATSDASLSSPNLK